MKKPEDTMPTDLDSVEDLTLFANESFDTEEIDLFEFTGNDDSPLTRLKSIILSLDWEISDSILQELLDEVTSLQQLWEGDKVAQVYLQGLHKIGSYLRSEGAYAHPNAIKLLLGFFYNFEKIISSDSITADAISSMLKSDVRKFKILQYQINQKGTVAEADKPADTAELAIHDDETVLEEDQECEPLTCLKATILGLEWEVTDKGLEQFNSQVNDIRKHFTQNKSAQILIQGLQALGAYITDERANAHPDAFSMLHSFYEGLELLLGESNLDEKEKQSILIDRVNRLNALKLMIAEEKEAREQYVEESLVDDDEVLPPVEENEEETLESLPDIDEPAVAQKSDFLDPDAIMPVEDTIADNLIEEELRIGGATIAALHDEKEPPDIGEGLELSEEVGEEELDLFFADGEEDSEATVDTGAEDEEMVDLELPFSDEDLDIALGDEDTDEEEELLLEEGEVTDSEEAELDQLFIDEAETGGLSPALAEADEEGGFDEKAALESLPETPTDEIDDKLDAFFGLEEEEKDEIAKAAVTPPADEDTSIAPALFDAEEEGGFDEHEVAADLEQAPMGEIEDKLDAFFGLDEDETDEIAEATESGTGKEDEVSVMPALADADEEGGFDEETVVAGMSEEPSPEIEDKLDAFFSLDEDEPDESDAMPASDEKEGVMPALSDADEDEGVMPALADADEDEDEGIMPALADAEEEGGFDEETVVAGLREEPSPEIEDKLDAFFSLDEEKTTTTTPADAGDTNLVTTLGAGLAGLAAGVTATTLTKSKECVRTLKKESSPNSEETVLLELVETTLTLLPEGETPPPAMQELLDSLQGQLERGEIGTVQLMQAISSTLLAVAREVAATRKKG